ncbi:MAG TPA: lipoprotein-releasing ABC transporter permease subunit [Gammaproteobacteria bacterium]|nr:lipoprotein-releasing ABC transporter permease subunit [Gammaproteobacteria bacterium]
MFRPLECFIALRYVRSRRRRGFISFISLASMLGIAIGVAALIVILSVMNGFEAELRSRLLSMTAHASVTRPPTGIEDWTELAVPLRELPNVVGVAPFVNVEAMLGSAGARLRPALIRGVDPVEEAATSDLGRYVQIGSLGDLEPGSGRLILGRVLALSLGLEIGSRVTVLVPEVRDGRIMPQLRSFVVSGIFEAGITDHDASLALASLADASELAGLRGRVEGVGIRLQDPLAVGALAASIAALGAEGAQYSDWTIENSSFFRAIHIEKTMMTLILLLIVAVAAFNIVASLVMLVTDKEKDIAILRTYGLEPKRIARIFMIQGTAIGAIGTIGGLALGLVLALNVETIVPWLESTFNFQIMPGDVYYVTEIPSQVQWLDVTVIPLLALTVAALATIYPSRRAAAIAPAEALRYD